MHAEKEQQDVIVQITKDFEDMDIDLTRIKRLVKSICLRFGRDKVPPAEYEIDIAIVDDAQISKINSQFLGRSNPTDCLSFDLSDDTAKGTNIKSFELVVNAEIAVKEAKLRGHSSEAELALYITHGLLHNLGFDDSTQEHAKKMHDTEDEVLQQHGFGLVYNKNKSR